jgi:glycosyltransferase involved in cell wall biosynthesis
MTVRPLLSICIPTFNRARLLRSALWSLVPQVNQVGDQVEVIVSDNCSVDDTPQVVRWAQQYMPIRYHRNRENVGPTANFFILTNELAHGEFGWLLGDDDLTRENAVTSVVDTIQTYPTFDYIFINHSYEQSIQREKNGGLVTGADFPELRNLLCHEIQNHIVQHWEDIIRYSHTPALFTSIVSSVFRLSRWREESAKIKVDPDDSYRSLENTFPHVCVVMRMMVGKPSVYLGYPHVILFTGSQEWFGDWPTMLFVHVLKLADLFEELGVDKRLADYYRQTLFDHSAQQFNQLLFHPSRLSRDIFSLRKLVMRYWNNISFWRMFWTAFRIRVSQSQWVPRKRLISK